MSMRSKEEIISEITDIKCSIDEYKSALIEIDGAIEFICNERETLESTVCNLVRGYDMTKKDEWLGSLEQSAEQARMDICSDISHGQSDVATSINDLRRIEDNIKSLMQESMARIARLETELDSDLSQFAL